MAKERILVTDDEQGIRESLQMVLEYGGYEVVLAEHGKRCLEILEGDSNFGVVLLDIKMPELDGMQVLDKIRANHPGIEVVMISGHADIEVAIKATRMGAFDLAPKPLDTDRLEVVVRNAIEKSRLQRENLRLAGEMAGQWRILGESKVTEELRVAIATAAPSQARVFITGENGTGKELIARSIHAGSPAAAGPFIDVNCAAIPKELIESELFGHVKGAFTGADRDRPGKFEMANGGTLFLDEIGDMPLEAQAKVLRVLEENKVTRVGSSEAIEVNVRVLAATNRDVDEMIASNEFREDLYYRLCVIPINSPPLRDRGDDVALLARHFLREMCDRNNAPQRELADSAITELKKQTWPGNVRQLRNFMERVAIMAPEKKVAKEDIQRFLRGPATGGGQLDDVIATVERFDEFQDEAERRYLTFHLGKNDWNIKKTAEGLGMQRSNLYKKIEKYGLR